MRTSGLVLDLYDDSRGEQLRELFPTRESLPETVKTAHALSSVERERLPDDTYALVLLNGDERLRKYACVDKGNTYLSVQYFLKNAHKLPEEAQKTAALNLIEACDWYDIDVPPELEKAAGIGGAVLGLGTKMLGAAAKNPLGAIDKVMKVQQVANLGKEMAAGARAAGAAGEQVLSPSAMQGLRGQFMKAAEVSGTDLAPLAGRMMKDPEPSKTPSLKTARVGHLVKHEGTEKETELPGADSFTTHTLPPQPQSRALKPYVDVSSKEASVKLVEKKASRYALGDKYPLDSYEQVKRASAYFEEYGKRLAPEERHEYCVNLVKRASELLIEVPEDVRKYGSESFAEATEVKMAFDARRPLLQTEKQAHVLASLEKIATSGESGLEELVCEALCQFDKQAGLDNYYDNYIPDPYFSLLGSKTAGKDDWSAVIGNDMVNEEQLRCLAKSKGHMLKHLYGEDFAKEFAKDPASIFDSLPVDQKKMLMRMATDNGPVENI